MIETTKNVLVKIRKTDKKKFFDWNDTNYYKYNRIHNVHRKYDGIKHTSNSTKSSQRAGSIAYF